MLTVAEYPIIDSRELAERWVVPVSWIRWHTRPSYHDPIPHLKLGKYVRFEWGHPELLAWLERHRTGYVAPKRGS